jgi:mRNA interferase MazF
VGAFVKGDVVILPFPFSDLSGARRRPALVVAELSGDDLIVCQITEQSRFDSYSIPLNPGDFASGGLNQPSVIRPNRLFTADARVIAYRAGVVSLPIIEAVITRIVEILRQ